MSLKSLKNGAAALVAALSSSAVFAADGDGRYAPDVPGSVPCANVASYDRDSEQTKVLAAFASGYISAHSKLTEGVYDMTPWETPEFVMLQARRFCEANPERRFTEALDAYVRFLEPNAITQAQNTRPVTNGGQTVLLYQATIDKARARLDALGFAGDDGLEGLAAFQAERGLPVTGLPDQATLALLFSE
ncbi:MAG: peptidoglycan-binding domain-containing protein [Pseudomonadota bacterium]